MTDSIPTYNVYDRAARLHIAPEEPRILYLLETSHSLDEDISEILKRISFHPSQEHFNSADRSFLCHSLSCQISGRFFTGNCTSYARMIVDTVNAEALARVRVSLQQDSA